MSSPEQASPDQAPNDALVAVLLEIERHVDAAGWDQAARLFALVPTDQLLLAEPGLADRLRRPDGLLPAEFTAIEQEHFVTTADLVDDLARVSWPESVTGCAIAVERMFLSAQLEVDLPSHPAEAAEVVAAHPQRQEIRVVVGVDRTGAHHGVARVRSEPNELLGGADLVPGLAEVLAHTLG